MELNGKTITSLNRDFLQSMQTRPAKAKGVVLTVPSVAAIALSIDQKKGVSSNESLIPHLPPYASQYRDFIIQKIDKKATG